MKEEKVDCFSIVISSVCGAYFVFFLQVVGGGFFLMIYIVQRFDIYCWVGNARIVPIISSGDRYSTH